MVKAPVPGVAAAEAARTAAATIRIKFTARKDTFLIPPAGLLPIRDKIDVRKATGMSYESFLRENTVGEDTLVVLWWLGRRQTELGLDFDTASSEWAGEAFSADELSLEYVDLMDDEEAAADPE